MQFSFSAFYHKIGSSSVVKLRHKHFIMRITILSVGKKHNDWAKQGIEEFSKRLRQPFEIEFQLISSSKKPDRLQSIDEESARLLSSVKPTDFVILLDETGKNLSSDEVLSMIIDNSTKQIVIIIGGAFGVNADLRERADFVWSLSKLVFPHQLVRLILVEQLYRAQEIYRGSGYHHA